MFLFRPIAICSISPAIMGPANYVVLAVLACSFHAHTCKPTPRLVAPGAKPRREEVADKRRAERGRSDLFDRDSADRYAALQTASYKSIHFCCGLPSCEGCLGAILMLTMGQPRHGAAPTYPFSLGET